MMAVIGVCVCNVLLLRLVVRVRLMFSQKKEKLSSVLMKQLINGRRQSFGGVKHAIDPGNGGGNNGAKITAVMNNHAGMERSRPHA